MTRAAALIIAAGRGRRFGGAKQFAPLGGRPVLAWSVAAFARHPRVDRIILVLPPGEDDAPFRALDPKVRAAVAGGTHRQDSVRNGFERIEPDGVELVLVHDGVRPVVAAALKLAPMLFVRPGELRALRWQDIDFAAAEWRFVASKTGQAHIVPLPKQAVAILRDLRPLTGLGTFAFPNARDRSRPMSENSLTTALRRLGVDKTAATLHGFRATARTLLVETLGFPPHLVEHQLAHAVRDPNGRAYNRCEFLPERRAMLQVWSDHIHKLAADAAVGGAVVELEGA